MKPKQRNILTFNQLSAANSARLGQFTNCHGEKAHAPDKPLWDRAAWLEAMVGELGEYCNDSKKWRRGDLTKDEFIKKAQEEIGGTLLYLDLLCRQIGIEIDEPFTLGYCAAYEFNRKSAQIGIDMFLTDTGDFLYRSPSEMSVWSVPGVND